MRKNNNYKKYILYTIVIIIFIISFLLRGKVLDIYTKKVFGKFAFQNTALTQSEREEFELLKVQNKTLLDENKRLKDDLGFLNREEGVDPVELLRSGSNLYGDFYVSLPKNKTAYKGMNIYSEGNILVGTVSEIFSDSMLVSNLAQDKGVIASDLETDEFLEIRSLGAGLYIATIPGGSKIDVGSQIVLKGNPKAIIGTVVERQSGDNSQTRIYLRTPYNILTKQVFYVIQ